MKVSREKARENRETILNAAADLFREHGIEGVTVADVMKAANLTHGGFYGHFESKEDLVAQACARAVSNQRQAWMQCIAQADGDPFKALAETYLNKRYRDDRGGGCPIAALGGELARYSPATRKIVTRELRYLIDSLTQTAPVQSASAQKRKAMGAYAGYIGAMILSRIVDDPKFSNEILEAAEDHFTSV